MLNKRIPRSKKIGVIGLAALVLLGAFLLPMAMADKTISEETFALETVSNLEQDVAVLEADNLDVLLAEPIATGVSRVARGTPSLGIPILDDELFKSRSEIQTARAVIVKDIAEIEAIKYEIESLKQQIQTKRHMLHQKEAELARMQPDRNARTDDYVQSVGVPTTSEPKRPVRSFTGAGGPVRSFTGAGEEPEYTGELRTRGKSIRLRGESAAWSSGVALRQQSYGRAEPQKNVSDEVRNELQRILPGLLREMLPRLLAEAMTKAAGNNDPYQSMTDSVWGETMAAPRMPAPRVKTKTR